MLEQLAPSATPDDLRQWTEELARDPMSVAFLPLGEALRRQGRLEHARLVATRGVARHPDNPDARDLLARVLADRGEMREAFAEWDATLRLAPDHVGAMKGMAFVRFQQGMLKEAERLLVQADAGGSDATIAAAIETVRRSSGGVFQSFVSEIADVLTEHLSGLELRTIPQRRSFLDPEKVVWHWPDLGARLIEDIR